MLSAKQKESYVLERARYWSERLGVSGKTVEVAHIVPDSGEDDDDVQAQPYLASLEELIVTSVERALMEGKWDGLRKLTKKTRGQVMADVDDSLAEYGHFKIRLYPALMSYDGDDFKLVADSVICHECIHMALQPYTSYAYYICEKEDKR